MYRVHSGPTEGFGKVFSSGFNRAGDPPSGAHNSFSRANQFLPGDWSHLSRGDLDRISRMMGQYLRASPGPSIYTIEACLMIEAILSTGRTFEELYPVQISRLPGRTVEIEEQPPGLYLINGEWSWWLPAGGPERKFVEDLDLMVPVVPNAWLPVSKEFHGILSKRLDLRPNRDWLRPGPLFTDPADAFAPRISAILSGSPRGEGIPRRSASTIQAAERWMLSGLLHQAGGDLGTASIVTSRPNSVARAMTHYGSVPVHRAVAAHKQAIKRLGRKSHNQVPGSLADKAIGEPATPKDEAVRNLIRTLLARLRDPEFGVAQKHEAMTQYTFALLAYAAALRGTGRIPGLRGIDHATGFATVADKSVNHPGRTRLTWVCKLARKQLRQYEIHLDLLADSLGIQARNDLEEIRASARGKLPLVKVVDRYRVSRLSFDELHQSLKLANWPGEPNAGRHWIRSKLFGRCSHETLAAFFGHWQIGAESWRDTSGLDPLLYRADLERLLDQTLKDIGWEECPSPLSGQASLSSKAPEAPTVSLGAWPEKLAALLNCAAPRPDMSPEARAGQLLASAIFHGAFLDREWWSHWLEAAFRGPVKEDDLVWLELEPLDPLGKGPYSQGRRWFADPVTRASLGYWHGRGGIPTTALPEDCLSQYLVGAAGDTDAVELLVTHAQRRWHLHMPPLLVAHAKGQHRSVPVDTNSWNRVLGFSYDSVPVPEKPPTERLAAPWCAAEANVVSDAVRDYKKGPKHQLGVKKAAARALSNIVRRSPAQALLNQWCINAFRYKRGRNQAGLAPTTVEDYLNALCRHVIDENDDLCALNPRELAKFFDMKLAAISNLSQQGAAFKAVRSLYYTLRSVRDDLGEFPAFLEDYRHDQKASANLISPEEYDRALGICRNDYQRLCLILGFRCGLRFDEVCGVTVHDFYISKDIFELTIIRNEHRNLKTPKSRRVLPLNILVEANERQLIKDLIARRREEFLIVPGKPCIVDKQRLSEGFEGKGKIEDALGRLLNAIVNVPCTFHHLRHSFASYLVSTLLLPDGCPVSAVPASLRSVVSHERKFRVAGPLLGEEKLGQHSLHAVSQAMGHIVPYTTTSWYCHLLDLSVLQHVSRPLAEAWLPSDEVLRLTGRSRPNRSAPPHAGEEEPWRVSGSKTYRKPRLSHRSYHCAGQPGFLQVSSQIGARTRRWEKKFEGLAPRKHADQSHPATEPQASSSWRIIKGALEAQDEQAALALHPDAIRWRKSAEQLRSLLMKSGLPRHSFERDRQMQSLKWITHVDTRWPSALRLTALERETLFFVVEYWDPSRGGVRFSGLQAAVQWFQFFKRLGFKETEFVVRATGEWTGKFSKSELLRLLRGTETVPSDRRRKRRGTIAFYLKAPEETSRASKKSRRYTRSAGHFVLIMLAIREGYGLDKRKAIGLTAAAERF